MYPVSKDFIVGMNYASKYGLYNPKKNKKQAYIEFGKIAENKMIENKIEFMIPNGLNGVWWDEIKQFVDKGVIDWSWTKKLWN